MYLGGEGCYGFVRDERGDSEDAASIFAPGVTKAARTNFGSAQNESAASSASTHWGYSNGELKDM